MIRSRHHHPGASIPSLRMLATKESIASAPQFPPLSPLFSVVCGLPRLIFSQTAEILSPVLMTAISGMLLLQSALGA
jgi:hypothetical protein